VGDSVVMELSAYDLTRGIYVIIWYVMSLYVVFWFALSWYMYLL
jgi:hypothetical protein